MSLHDPINFVSLRPIKIGLLGGAGSNKTLIAKRIARRLNNEVEEKAWYVIDGYVDKLSARTGRTFGEVYDRSAFPLSLQVIAERWTLEDAETTLGRNTITCGTVYESLIFSAAQSMPIAHMSDEQLMMEESYIAKLMIESIRTVAAIRFDYDLLFYLPLDQDKKDKDWATVVDDKLSEVLAGQGLTAIVLDGTIKEKVTRGTELIREVQSALAEEASADDERRAIRERDADGEGQEPESEQVSDVSPDEAADSSGHAGDNGMD